VKLFDVAKFLFACNRHTVRDFTAISSAGEWTALLSVEKVQVGS
jgi:hypothetical protein